MVPFLKSAWKAAYITPLHKGGDPSQLDNYRPISKLSVLAKKFENLLVNTQLKYFLSFNSTLPFYQSDCRPKHRTVTAATKVIGDIQDAVTTKNHCVSLFL